MGKVYLIGAGPGDPELLTWKAARIPAQADVVISGRFRTVVRLKGGNLMIFARGAEEWEVLARHDVDVEVVPGISSSIAVPSPAEIPLTCRGVAASFAIVAGHRQSLRPTGWARYSQIDTLVILMGVENRRDIASHLIRSGRRPAEPVAFIERGSTERERIVTATLDEVARGAVEVESPAVFVIGEVVRLRERLAVARQEAYVGA